MEAIIVIRNIVVENANAIAGQTWGFPAISNFLGYTHALQRRLPAISKLDIADLSLSGCGVICHQHEVQAYQAAGYSEHVFSLTRNPLTKEAKSPSFVEEGRMNMTVSLVIAIDEFPTLNEELDIPQLEQEIKQLAESQRLAGGTITSITSVKVKVVPDGTDEREKQATFWLRTLLPGFALVSRSDLLMEQSQLFSESESPELEAWLDASTLQIDAERKVKPKPYSGWIRPVPVGYKAISPLYPAGEVARSRDNETSVCFVEMLYSLGEWVSPHRIKRFEDLMWSHTTESNHTHYLCSNSYQPESIQQN